uniref:C2H2-type domain-containing protein n=2 Tax=Parascaris univalens TaxID=6257 RepID=A0A915BM51_PARUN
MQPPDVDITKQTLAREIGVARAVYDNEAEWPDELAFKRGEILRVLDERPCASGNESHSGWWYCVNKDGQRGLVPSNRLRMMHRFDNGDTYKVITPQRFGDLFMFDDDEKSTHFRGFDDSFLNYGSSSFIRDPLPSLSFDTGSIFDRIFPLSPVERFNNTSLRKMSSGDTGGTSGIVRNIPIKIEGTGNIVQRRDENDERGSFPFSTNRSEQQSSAPPPSLTSYQSSKSGGHLSPPPPPRRKYLNSPLSPPESSNNDEQERNRDAGRLTEVPITVNASGSNRPFVAPKPRLGGICDSGKRRTDIKDMAESDYDKPRKDIDDVAEVSWRLGKIGKPSGSMAGSSSRISPMGLSGLHLSLPSKTNGLHINAASEANPPHDSDVGCGHVNMLAVDDVTSPSPSSSGIVADINDSHADSNQRASATSSLSAGSSSDHSSDHNDYDHPLPNIDVGTALQPPVMVRTTPPGRQPQPQLRPAQLMQRSVLATSEKNELGSTSVLQNVFDGLGVERNGAVDEDDSRFSRSLNLDSHLSANSRFNRSPSIPPETMYGIRSLSDDRQRRVTNVPPEVISTQCDEGITSS